VTTAFRKCPRLIKGASKDEVAIFRPGVGKTRAVNTMSDNIANRAKTARSRVDK
jgi:replicative DNA helicase